MSNFQLYLKNKKKFSFKTIINFIELTIKLFFLTKYLSNKNFQKEIIISKKNKLFFDTIEKFVKKYSCKYV